MICFHLKVNKNHTNVKHVQIEYPEKNEFLTKKNTIERNEKNGLKIMKREPQLDEKTYKNAETKIPNIV